MKRQCIKENNATTILCTPELSSGEEEELKKYKQFNNSSDKSWERYKRIASPPDPKFRPKRPIACKDNDTLPNSSAPGPVLTPSIFSFLVVAHFFIDIGYTIYGPNMLPNEQERTNSGSDRYLVYYMYLCKLVLH